jgi:hypothetical protein
VTYDIACDRARIAELVEGHGVEFTGADVLRLRGPIVYLLCRGEQPLYVGMSRHGLGRPFNDMHRALHALTESDRLQVWPVASLAAAMELEWRLIRHLMPAWNIAGRANAVAGRLGIAPKSTYHTGLDPRRASLALSTERENRATLTKETVTEAPWLLERIPVGVLRKPYDRLHRDALRVQRRSRRK